jgi:hypothetical protein
MRLWARSSASVTLVFLQLHHSYGVIRRKQVYACAEELSSMEVFLPPASKRCSWSNRRKEMLGIRWIATNVCHLSNQKLRPKDGRVFRGHNLELAFRSEYARWADMKQRCHNAKRSRYSDYGSRGIKVSSHWRKSFLPFLADMGPAPPGVL